MSCPHSSQNRYADRQNIMNDSVHKHMPALIAKLIISRSKSMVLSL